MAPCVHSNDQLLHVLRSAALSCTIVLKDPKMHQLVTCIIGKFCSSSSGYLHRVEFAVCFALLGLFNLKIHASRLLKRTVASIT